MSTRCVFLDRDGVINEKPAPGEYIRSCHEFRLLPNIVDWIRLFNALGYLVIVITNQRGVALGMTSAEDIDLIHRKLLYDLAAKGARIDAIYCCPHALESCECRKPKPGLVYAARDKWDIDLTNSLLLGDSDCDERLAATAGVPFLRVVDGHISSEELMPRSAELSAKYSAKL